MDNEEGIHLHRMVQLREAVNMNDVWTGVSDPIERKKRQNRLNQRAYKRRRAAEQDTNRTCTEVQVRQRHPYPEARNFVYGPLPAAPLESSPPLDPQARSLKDCVRFPLSLDHLLTLVQFNVLRAMMTNMRIMSVMGHVVFECNAMFAVSPADDPNKYTTIPSTFAYTSLQRITPHEFWIDIVPCGQLRDNLIIATQDPTFDGDAFCVDIVGGLFDGFNDVELKGLVAWTDPWSPCGWEVTEGFLQKWGFLLKGCVYMLRATNKWRAIRGEDPLVWEV